MLHLCAGLFFIVLVFFCKIRTIISSLKPLRLSSEGTQ